jgi:hypothetical protein
MQVQPAAETGEERVYSNFINKYAGIETISRRRPLVP